MKPLYKEGSLFAVPLRSGGFAIGVVARTSPDGIILVYFFGPNRKAVPTEIEVNGLQPQDALQIARVGDMSLVDTTWPLIGQLETWKPLTWKMPPFVRRDDIAKKAWRVQYSDTNANQVASEESIAYSQASEFDRDAVLGAGAAEIRLTKLLA